MEGYKEINPNTLILELDGFEVVIPFDKHKPPIISHVDISSLGGDLKFKGIMLCETHGEEYKKHIPLDNCISLWEEWSELERKDAYSLFKEYLEKHPEIEEWIVESIKEAIEQQESREVVWGALEDYVLLEEQYGVETDSWWEMEREIKSIAEEHGLTDEEIKELKNDIMHYKQDISPTDFVDDCESDMVADLYGANYWEDIEYLLTEELIDDARRCAYTTIGWAEWFNLKRGTCEVIKDNWGELKEKYGEKLMRDIRKEICE